MNNNLIVIGIGVLVVVVIALAIYGMVREYKRCRAIQAAATLLGFRYQNRDSNISYQFAVFDIMKKGENRYGYNVMEGKYQDEPVMAFDYHYEVESGSGKDRHTSHYYHSLFLVQQTRDLPDLRIYPENIFSKIGQFLGYEDIDFESAEFSKAFTVRCKDKKFAYDICHTRMMEYLLAHRKFHIEMCGPWVALIFDNVMKPEQVEERLNCVVEIRKLFPQYLYEA